MKHPAVATPARRTDIQGLRAIGALLVAIYHIWVGRVSGGVDVFFLISGYLLIGSLSRQLVHSGGIALMPFTAGLARRLLPSAFCVILVILATGWLWLPRMRWDETIHQLAASTVYLENWLLAFNSVDYLARDEVGSPVQHYWAMSTQVQALLLIALVLALTGAAAGYTGKRVSTGGVSGVLCALFCCSLAYSIHATAVNQPFAYFDSFARIWEFAAGGIVAMALPALRLTTRQRQIGGWLGLAAVLSCGIILDVSSIFPGFAALWPVAAAAAILVCGEGPAAPGGVDRLLGSRPLVWLGNISYALYLWHWPVLVAYLTLSYRSEASLPGGAAVLLVSVALAYWTTELVEKRFRRPAAARPALVALSTAAAIGCLTVALAIWNYSEKALYRAETATTITQDRYPGAMALSPQHFDAGENPIYPGPLTAKASRPKAYRDGCVQSMAGREVIRCVYGPGDAPFSLAVVGGSHSAHWLPALTKALAAQPDWKVVTYLKAACPFSTELITEVAAYRESCEAWNQTLSKTLLATRPAMVFTLATRTTYPGSAAGEEVPEGYRRQWLPLLDAGIEVLAVRDTPRFGFNVPECVEVKGRTSARCTLRRRELLAAINPARALPEADKLHLVDLSDHICTQSICPPVIGSIAVYRDKGHITADYMATMAAPLSQALVPILARAVQSPSSALVEAAAAPGPQHQ